LRLPLPKHPLSGADVIQLDEPWVRDDPAVARRHSVNAINSALRGIPVPANVHLCFGYAVVVPGDSKPARPKICIRRPADFGA